MRLDVVGALWGTLEVHKKARVRDLNQDGALLEYPVPVLPDTAHTVTIDYGGQSIALDVRVRHVRLATGQDGSTVYLAGVEFMSSPAILSGVQGSP